MFNYYVHLKNSKEIEKKEEIELRETQNQVKRKSI
jgi:hypothetical protein